MGVKLVGSAILAFGACLVIWPIDPFMSQSHAGVSSISYSRDGGQRRNIQLLISSGRLFRVGRSYNHLKIEEIFRHLELLIGGRTISQSIELELGTQSLPEVIFKRKG